MAQLVVDMAQTVHKANHRTQPTGYLMKAVPVGLREESMIDHGYTRVGEPYELTKPTAKKAALATPASAS